MCEDVHLIYMRIEEVLVVAAILLSYRFNGDSICSPHYINRLMETPVPYRATTHVLL